MTRAHSQLRYMIRWRWKSVFTRDFWFWMPRPGYCLRCGAWCWRTNERPAYSAFDGAFICEECAEINDAETDQAWRDYYASVL